jgi:hypothetical protein
MPLRTWRGWQTQIAQGWPSTIVDQVQASTSCIRDFQPEGCQVARFGPTKVWNAPGVHRQLRLADRHDGLRALGNRLAIAMGRKCMFMPPCLFCTDNTNKIYKGHDNDVNAHGYLAGSMLQLLVPRAILAFRGPDRLSDLCRRRRLRLLLRIREGHNVILHGNLMCLWGLCMLVDVNKVRKNGITAPSYLRSRDGRSELSHLV